MAPRNKQNDILPIKILDLPTINRSLANINHNFDIMAQDTQLVAASLVDLTTDVTNILPIGNGGTGADTAGDAFVNIAAPYAACRMAMRF